MECPPDKIRNPVTKRCVLKTSKIGKELLDKKNLLEKKIKQFLSKTDAYCPTHGFRQTFGTCWFNSIINSLMLGERSAYHFRTLYNEYSKKEQKLISKEIDKDERDTCPRKLNKIYILKRMYPIILAPENIHMTEKSDLAVEMINKLNIRSPYWNRMIGFVPTIGTERLMKCCFNEYEYILSTIEEIKNKSLFLADLTKDLKYIILSNDLLKTININKDNDKFVGKLKIQNELDHTVQVSDNIVDDFILDACIISFSTKSYKHVISGYQCGGKYFIYDSNAMTSFEFDWTQPDMKLSSLPYYSHTYKSVHKINDINDSSTRIYLLFYVRK